MAAEDGTDSTIPLHYSTKRFMQGVTAAQKVRDAHKDQDFPNHQARLALFWFYVGAIAVDEYGITEQEDFCHFVFGAATRAPQEVTE